MAILKYGNKAMRYGAKSMQYALSWTFLVRGSAFPYSGTSVGTLGLQWMSASSIQIDFADGTGYHTFQSRTNGTYRMVFTVNGDNSSPDFYSYIYQDGNSGLRRITVIVTERFKLISLTLNKFLLDLQPLTIKFSELPALSTLVIGVNNNLSYIDDSVRAINNLRSISLTTPNFDPSSRYYKTVPFDFLIGKSITTYFQRDDDLSGMSFAQSNLDKLAPNIGSTCTNLTFTGMGLADTNGTDGPIPSNWNQFTALLTVSLGANKWTSIPSFVFPALTNLDLSNMTALSNWGDLSGCPNLTTLVLSNSWALDPNMPLAFLLPLTKLKTFKLQGMSATGVTGRLDPLISAIYNFYATYAPMSGNSSTSYRSVTIDFTKNVGRGEIPSGIYQQPSGYVQSISNGTPTNSLEKIWVLVNQFGHNITYATF